MRQRQTKTRDAIEETNGFREICPKGKQRRGTAKREPMADGLARKKECRRFTQEEIEWLFKRRQELIASGMKDRQIGKIVSLKMGRSLGSVTTLIIRYVNKKIFPKNRNNTVKLSHEEIEYLKCKWLELAAKGKNDTQISKEIALSIDRSESSVHRALCRLAGKKLLPGNTNNRKMFGKAEIEIIRGRRAELISEGMKDRGIAKRIAEERGWGFPSTESRMIYLVKIGALSKNPNRFEAKDFTPAEIVTIIQKRTLLIEKGLRDEDIAHILAKDLKRAYSSVDQKIRQLRKDKKIEENPKKKKGFKKEEIEIIARRRSELVSQGLTDRGIAIRIAKELGRSFFSTYGKIEKLVEECKLPENQNKMEAKDFSEEEKFELLHQRELLIPEGFTDLSIAKKISKGSGRNYGCVYVKIKELVRKKGLGENPNKKNTNRFSKEEIEIAVNLYHELVSTGMHDRQIARLISKKLGRSLGSINTKLSRLQKRGQLPKNPNMIVESPTENELLSGLLRAPEAMEKFGEQK